MFCIDSKGIIYETQAKHNSVQIVCKTILL